MKYISQAIAITVLSLFHGSGILPAQAQSTVPQRPVTPSMPAANGSTSNTQTALPTQTPNGDGGYEQAKQQLPTDLYVLYRITERLSRANGLDDQAWRVQIAPTYDLSAFATDANLIAVYRGFLDQLDSDVDGMACVVAREMAHHTQQHQGLSQAEREQKLQQIQAEASNAMTQEIQEAMNATRRGSVGRSLLGSLGGLLGGVGGVFGGIAGSAIGGLAGSAVGNQGQDRIMNAQDRYQEVFQAKVAEFEKQQTELIQSQGLEADAIGYRYMATAGFNPEGCVRAITTLDKFTPSTPILNASLYGMPFGSQDASSELDIDANADSMPNASSAPPSTPINTGGFTATNRIDRLRQVMSTNPPQALAMKGRNQLTLRYQPLTYSLSADEQTVRVNSQRGTQNVDQLFPQ